MPVYQVGDLVHPADQWNHEENPAAIGIIVEIRSMRHLKPELKVLWNDMLDVGPKWTFIDDVAPIEQQACNGPETVV